MKNILLADAGGTKTEWLLIGSDSEVKAHVLTPGINALLTNDDEIRERLRSVKSELGQDESLSEIHYYGAGCATTSICEKLRNAISDTWQSGVLHVESDLLAAARAMLGHERGIACILGTGSNTGLYNGREIEFNVPSLGYILGDEGSGAALGKRLVADAFKGSLPKPIRDKFMSYYELDLDSILEYTYWRPAANRFLASLVPFIRDHIWNPYMYSLVLEEFTAFLKRNVAMYAGSRSLPLVVTGGVAATFPEILQDAASRQGFKVDKIVKKPMAGLIAFHTGRPSKEDF